MPSAFVYDSLFSLVIWVVMLPSAPFDRLVCSSAKTQKFLSRILIGAQKLVPENPSMSAVNYKESKEIQLRSSKEAGSAVYTVG